MAVHLDSRRRMLSALGGLAGLSFLPLARALSGELTLAGDPALGAVLTAATRQFEKDGGPHVVLEIVKPSQLASVLKGMDPPDLVVLPQDEMDRLARSGQLAADSRRRFGRAGLSLAVRSGAAVPDVSTPEALKQALVGAKSVAYPDPSDTVGGSQAAQLIGRLGLTEALKGKTTLGSGSNPLAAVSLGTADIGLQTRHEALATSGLTLASPLPVQLQPWREYGIALTGNAPNVAEAKRLMDYFATDAGRAVLDARGLWS